MGGESIKRLDNGDAFTDMSKWGKVNGEEYKKGTSDNPKFGKIKETHIPLEDLEGTSPSPEDILLEKEDAGYEELREGEDVLKIADSPVPESGDFGVIEKPPKEEILVVDEFVPTVGGTLVTSTSKREASKKDQTRKANFGPNERARQSKNKGKNKNQRRS